MRVLKKQAISRRSFLKGSTVTALGLTVIGPTIFGKNSLLKIKKNLKILEKD